MTNTKVNEMMNNAEQVLISNNVRVTGTRNTIFASLKDAKIEEIELLSFLIQFPESIQAIKEGINYFDTTEHMAGYKSVDCVISKAKFKLNKIYNFPFCSAKSEEIHESDKVDSISHVHMKDRHIIYLDILRKYDMDVDDNFVDAYNKIPARLNPWRVEQTFSYLKEVLERKGIELSYPDYIKANPHACSGDELPYIHPSNYGFYIVDSCGGYGGKIGVGNKWDEKGAEWTYMSCRWANRAYGNYTQAEFAVEQLKELNAIADISGLTWKIEHLNYRDIIDTFHALPKQEQVKLGEYIIIHKDVPPKKIGTHKQFEKSIFQKYKVAFKVIEDAWKAKREGVTV